MEKIVEIKGLCKKFGKTEVLHDVSFDIYEDEIVGFIGPNGAGKSTTMKCMCNLIFPSAGTIKICGYDIVKEREKALAKQSSLIETPGLFPNLTGKENIEYFASYKKIPQSKIEEIIQFMNLGDGLYRRTAKYSLGMKQRLALGIALLSDPKLLILDEPTNGLDPAGVFDLRNQLKTLAKEKHVPILVSSHQLGELEKISDRYICINKGKIVENPKQMKNDSCYHITMKKTEQVEKLMEQAASVYSYTYQENGYVILVNFKKNRSNMRTSRKKSLILKPCIVNYMRHDHVKVRIETTV